MALETVMFELDARIRRAAQAWSNLQWAAVEAQPEGKGHALVDFYDTGATDLMSLCGEAAQAVGRGRSAARGKPDLTTVGEALALCHERVVRMRRRYSTELMALEWTSSLGRLAEERQGVWAIWVEGVRDALDQGQEPISEVEAALVPCWRELSDRSSARAFSVQTTAAGAQIFLDKDRDQ